MVGYFAFVLYMTLIHKLVLYLFLGFLGGSLVLPGVMIVLNPDISGTGLLAEIRDGINHFRALHGMMTAIGVIALWACWDLAHSRSLVLALGIIMVGVATARIYSLIIDGVPGLMTFVYLCLEILMAAVFLLSPPKVPTQPKTVNQR